MSFLNAFKNIIHVIEAAGALAAPVISVVNPTTGALIQQAINAAVNAELLFPESGNGAKRAEMVRAQTQATVDLTNGILTAAGKPPLPVNVTDVVSQQVKVVVDGLNAVQRTVQSR